MADNGRKGGRKGRNVRRMEGEKRDGKLLLHNAMCSFCLTASILVALFPDAARVGGQPIKVGLP